MGFLCDVRDLLRSLSLPHPRLEDPRDRGCSLRQAALHALQRPPQLLGSLHGVRVAANRRSACQRGGAEDPGNRVRRG